MLRRSLRFKRIAGTLLNTAVFAALLLAPARTLRWPRAWVFLAVVFVAAGLSILAIPEELLNERFKPPVQRGQPQADRILLVAFMVSFAAAMVFIPLDVFRFHLLEPPGAMVAAAGLALFATGWWIAARAMVENSFAVLVVRMQKERQQRVVDTGPYRIVRHPMYSGMIPMFIGMALWLGSYAAAMAAIVPTALISARIVYEERFLRRELPGYAEYAGRTRYRLVPYVW